MSFHRRQIEQESEGDKGSYTLEDLRRQREESEDTLNEDFDIDSVIESNKTHSRHEIFKSDEEGLIVNGKNRIVGANTGDALTNCDVCGKHFMSPESLHGHKLRAHSREDERKFQGQVLDRLNEILKNVRANRRR